jgi:hypothetical protein
MRKTGASGPVFAPSPVNRDPPNPTIGASKNEGYGDYRGPLSRFMETERERHEKLSYSSTRSPALR